MEERDTMIKWKKLAATVVAAAAAVSCVGCGNQALAYPLTIDGVKIKAGIYIYYSYQAYTEATSTIQKQNSDLDTTDEEVVKAQTIDGKDAETWIKDRTMEYCKEFVAIQKDFDAKGLELTTEQTNQVKNYISSAWDSSGETFEKNGIAESSVQDIFLSTYKEQELFQHYYGADGEKGVTEDELKEYYEDNDARVRYITFDLKDGNGDLLKDDGKKEMKSMVEDYLSVLKTLKDEDAINDKMDTIQEEYNAYVTSISEEAAAATATSATDENGNEIPATTTATTATTTSAETTTVTTVAADAESDSEAETTADTEETVTRAASDADSSDETTTTTVSGATEEESSDTTETTTTTAPYANESIITKVSTTDEKDKDNEDSINYTPSTKAYEAIFNDAKTDVPFIVEDDEAYYLIVRFDITKRMTDDDLWTEDQMKAVASRKYWDNFTDDKKEMANALNIDQQSDRAIKKYDPFKLDFSSSSSSSN